MSKKWFKNSRMIDKSKLNAKQIIIQLIFCFILGVILGVLAKFSDTFPANGAIGMFFNFISDITTNIGIWVALATLIAVWSRNPFIAAIKVLTFFFGMLLAYYIYSQMLFGFFPTYYFLHWGIIALLSPFAAYIVWYSRGEGWGAAICAALPIGLLLTQGYPFFYVFSIVTGFDLFVAILLLVLLMKSKWQYLKVVPLSILMFIILRNFNILSYIFGGF